MTARKIRKGKNTGPALVLSGLALVLLVLIIVFFAGGGREKVRHFIEANVPASPETPGGRPATKTVTLFFAAEDFTFSFLRNNNLPGGSTIRIIL